MPSRFLLVVMVIVFSSNLWANTSEYDDFFEERRAYDGFFISTSPGYGSLAHESFNKSPVFSSLGLGLGYDYYMLPNIGGGLSASSFYNHQVVSGVDVGGTYSGLNFNPINARLVFSFFKCRNCL